MIFTENSEFNLNGIEAREYPDIDLALSSDFVSMGINNFKNMILQTNYACSLDEARVVLTGVNVKIDKDNLECSATDSYRLALRKEKLTTGVNNGADIIIPSKHLNELLNLSLMDLMIILRFICLVIKLFLSLMIFYFNLGLLVVLILILKI